MQSTVFEKIDEIRVKCELNWTDTKQN